MTPEELQTRVRKLSMRATEAKMALHDLAEELPVDWQKIPEVAAAAHQIFAELAQARCDLKIAKAEAKV